MILSKAIAMAAFIMLASKHLNREISRQLVGRRLVRSMPCIFHSQKNRPMQTLSQDSTRTVCRMLDLALGSQFHNRSSTTTSNSHFLAIKANEKKPVTEAA